VVPASLFSALEYGQNTALARTPEGDGDDRYSRMFRDVFRSLLVGFLFLDALGDSGLLRGLVRVARHVVFVGTW
jgi:hypothetical protein